MSGFSKRGATNMPPKTFLLGNASFLAEVDVSESLLVWKRVRAGSDRRRFLPNLEEVTIYSVLLPLFSLGP